MYYTEKTVKELIENAYNNGRYDENKGLIKHGLGLPPLPSPEYALVGTEIKKIEDITEEDECWNESKFMKYPKHQIELVRKIAPNTLFLVLRPISKDELVKVIDEALYTRRHSASIMTPIAEYLADSIITLLNKGK